MNILRRKMHIWLGGLAMFAVLVVGSMHAEAAHFLVHTDPRDFLLRENDLPPEGKYAVPLHERHVITNDLVVYLLGDAAGEERIRRTGRIVGMKPAGGIRTAKEAIQYLVVLYETLGPRWMTPDWFRFGASSLLNDVLMQLEKERTGAYQRPDHFTID